MLSGSTHAPMRRALHRRRTHPGRRAIPSPSPARAGPRRGSCRPLGRLAGNLAADRTPYHGAVCAPPPGCRPACHRRGRGHFFPNPWPHSLLLPLTIRTTAVVKRRRARSVLRQRQPDRVSDTDGRGSNRVSGQRGGRFFPAAPQGMHGCAPGVRPRLAKTRPPTRAILGRCPAARAPRAHLERFPDAPAEGWIAWRAHTQPSPYGSPRPPIPGCPRAT